MAMVKRRWRKRQTLRSNDHEHRSPVDSQMAELAHSLWLMGQLGHLAINWRPGGLTNRVGQEACGYSAYSIKIRVLRAELQISGLLVSDQTPKLVYMLDLRQALWHLWLLLQGASNSVPGSMEPETRYHLALIPASLNT
jgi:hypothetical protein